MLSSLGDGNGGLNLSLAASLSPLWTFTRASSGTQFAANVKSTAGTNVPRFETSAAGAAQGILLEPQSTNLMPWSNDLTQATNWASGSVTAAFNAAGPDGATSATTLTTTAAGNIHRGSFVVTPGTVYTCSFLVKAGTMTALNYSVYDFTNANYTVPTTAYYSQINGTNYTRVQVTFTAAAGCVLAGICPIRDTISVGTVFVTGVQCEAVGFATSTIDTTGSTATRAADNLTLALSQFPALQTSVGYGLAFDFSVLAASQNLSVPFGVSAVGGFTDTVYGTLNGSGQLTITSIVAAAGVSSAAINLNSVGATNKVALAITPAGLRYSVNGAAAAGLTNAGQPAMTTLAVGRAPWSASNYCGMHSTRVTLASGPQSDAWLTSRSA